MCGCTANAAIIGTICRKRTTSATKGLGTSCRSKTSKWVHRTCAQSHIPQPEAMSAQKSCSFLSWLLMFERMAMVAQNSRTHCVRSPKEVNPTLRQANRDTAPSTQTTAHTVPVHLLGCRTEITPTLKVYVHSPVPIALRKYR